MAVDPFDEALAEWMKELLARTSLPFWRPPHDPELRWLLSTLFSIVSRARDTGAWNTAARQPILDALSSTQPQDLGLTATLELGNRLRELLIEYGDDDYLLSCYEEGVAYAQRPNEPAGSVSWASLYGNAQPDAVGQLLAGASPTDVQRASLRHGLLALQRARWHFYGLDRARANVKGRYMLFLALALIPLLGALSAGIALSVDGIGWQVLLAASAGAAGSMVSGAFKLRDQISTVAQVRAFAPALLTQPLIGAVAGLFSLLLLASGVLHISDSSAQWATRGVIAFAIGFSEPFFLSTVNKVASLADHPPPAAKQ